MNHVPIVGYVKQMKLFNKTSATLLCSSILLAKTSCSSMTYVLAGAAWADDAVKALSEELLETP